MTDLIADDRITCNVDCANWIPGKGSYDPVCAAARRGEMKGVSKRYCPSLVPPRRCDHFRPKPGAADQRLPHERWPFVCQPPAEVPETSVISYHPNAPIVERELPPGDLW